MGLFGLGKVACAKCGYKGKKNETFECTACGRIVCWGCVANAYVQSHGWPSAGGDKRSAVMFAILAEGDRGTAPCPFCSKTAAKRRE